MPPLSNSSVKVRGEVRFSLYTNVISLEVSENKDFIARPFTFTVYLVSAEGTPQMMLAAPEALELERVQLAMSPAMRLLLEKIRVVGSLEEVILRALLCLVVLRMKLDPAGMEFAVKVESEISMESHSEFWAMYRSPSEIPVRLAIVSEVNWTFAGSLACRKKE